MTEYEWIHIGLLLLGFLGTWIFGAFKLGRAVEKMRSDSKQEIELDRDKILEKLEKLRNEIAEEQRSQDHNFGEVGAAMRQYITDVEKNFEKKVREVEIYGRDNYVKIPDFKDAFERLAEQIKHGLADIKDDIKTLRKFDQN